MTTFHIGGMYALNLMTDDIMEIFETHSNQLINLFRLTNKFNDSLQDLKKLRKTHTKNLSNRLRQKHIIEKVTFYTFTYMYTVSVANNSIILYRLFAL